MRIHRLEIQAFGPFAERQTIDFDALGEQGLFLLNGATGAGKTSVLDAICYAFYGSVPGARQNGKRLRSDHAPEGLEPLVICEFSARDRRLEVARSPAWDRPTLRGKGTTVQQAKTLLREKENGIWVEKSSRNDEAGGEIAALLGMKMEQFTKVILLAQGDFAAFLRSKDKDRQELLQSLFGTEVYENVEKQLALEALAGKSAVAAKEQELLLLEANARVQAEGVLEPAGTAYAIDDLESMHGAALFEALVDAVSQTHRRVGAQAATGRSAELGAAAALQDAELLAARHAKLQAAMAERNRLAVIEPDFARWQQQGREHREAEVLAGQLASVEAAEVRLTELEALTRTVLIRLTNDPQAADLTGIAKQSAEPSAAALNSIRSRLERTGATVEALLPEEERLAQVRAEVDSLTSAVHDSTSAAARHAEAARTADGQRSEVRVRVAKLKQLADQVEHRGLAAGAAQDLLATIRDHRAAQSRTVRCEEEHLQARRTLLDAQEHWLRLMAQRLETAAGEMAARLKSGEPCPVCGSEVHPEPSALAGTGLQAAEDEERAKLLRDEAETVESAAGLRVAAARQELAVLQGRGGAADLKLSQEAAASAQEELATSQGAVPDLARGEADLTLLTARIQEQESLAAAAREQLAAQQATLSATSSTTQELDAKLADSRDGFESLAARVSALHRVAELLAGAASAIQDRDAAKAAAGTSRTALGEALADTPFGSARAARAALLSAAEAATLNERIRAHSESVVRSEAAFDPQEVQAAATEAAEGKAAPAAGALADLRRAAEDAAQAAGAAVVRRELAANALAAVRNAAARHAVLEAHAAPLREHWQRVQAISDTARGMGENSYKMPLNTYVLAARLEQVAVAASERLGTMSDGRYTLSYSDALAGRNQKSGLGLDVVDQWTGQRRDTATLSGGESFMASLALALGLADVVQQETGGVDIETLFVDEGFGSLDEQSLEQVMDALEGLRDGGRVVGLVSHVAELKLRIPTQLQVHKGRTGSTLSVNHAAVAAA
ncbi:SMC family ATPase [Paenarthrobacter sp. Z7-10]|uniref:SMC family ATPase n=1 Tax=Paenarthrobacter sp. Z7-10 TaxID=2787635 RepID=UPI0022A8FCBA|nr:SMC family ATPase [Paenarthrobacter sp. Z7-10]MCZ2404137.1 SMC family ATPase [Paenarthrobacter sp. Z7-10]